VARALDEIHKGLVFMKRLSRKYVVAALAAVVVAAVVPAVVVASIITGAKAVGVSVAYRLKPNTNYQATATVDGIRFITTCTGATTRFQLTTKGRGLGPFTISDMALSGCTDNVGDTDTVTSNHTNGTWSTTYLSSPSSTAADRISIRIPKAGVTTTLSLAPGCVVTEAPSAAASFAGAYDNAGNLRITNASVPFATNSGCLGGASTGALTVSTVLKPRDTGTPGFAVTPAITGVK
jgi:hypothetical protein